MDFSDPTTIHQLRAAALIEAEQARTHRVPVSTRGRRRRSPTELVFGAWRIRRAAMLESPSAPFGAHDLFVGLDRRTLAALSQSFLFIDTDTGVSLGRQGEIAPEFIVILEGRIGVSLDGLPLAVLDPGSHFGALPLLDDGSTPYGRASFDVLEPGRVAVAGRQQFFDLLESFPVVARRIEAIVAVRRAYLAGRADAGAIAAAPAAGRFPLHIVDTA